MAQVDNFSEPIVRIVNSGIINREGYSSIEVGTELVSRGPMGWHDVRTAFSPVEVPAMADEDKDLLYEEAAIKEEEISPEVMVFVEDAKKFYIEVARNEGYIRGDEDIKFRMIFIPEEEFVRISSRELGSVSPNLRISTNSIYIPYPATFQQGKKLYMYESIFHELRHRVGRHVMDFVILPTDDEPGYKWELSQRLGMDYATAVPRGGNSAWEEIFVDGYELENIGRLENEELQRMLNKRREAMRNRGIDPRYIITWIDDLSGEQGYNEYRGYTDAYLVLKARIPNILDLMTAVRKGVAGSRHKIARAVLKEFGKEGLAGLVFAKGELRQELAYLLYGIAMDRLGKQASQKQSNGEIIRENLRMILNRHDENGALASRFGL